MEHVQEYAITEQHKLAHYSKEYVLAHLKPVLIINGLDALKEEGRIVMSSFVPTDYCPRPKVRIDGSRVVPIKRLTGSDNEFMIGSPGLLDQRYISRLPELDFDPTKIFHCYCKEGRLGLVKSELPIEVDVIEELKETIPRYKKHIIRVRELLKGPNQSP